MKSEIYFDEIGKIMVASENENLIERGDSGVIVVGIQSMLNCHFGNAERITVDGDFGVNTQRLIYKFQAANGLPKTGKVDFETLMKIMKG